MATTALGDEAAIKGFTRDDLVGFQQRWLRPDNAELFVVSDRPLAEVQPLLEQRFGDWHARRCRRGTKTLQRARRAPDGAADRADQPAGSPQSVIFGGELTPLDPRADIVRSSMAANDVLGGHLPVAASTWTCARPRAGPMALTASTGAARACRAVPVVGAGPGRPHRRFDRRAHRADRATSSTTEGGHTGRARADRSRATIDELPGQFETSERGARRDDQTNALYGRPDNYYETLAAKYRALTHGRRRPGAGARRSTPMRFVFVVVGDAAKVRPQLDKLGMPIEVVEAP